MLTNLHLPASCSTLACQPPLPGYQYTECFCEASFPPEHSTKVDVWSSYLSINNLTPSASPPPHLHSYSQFVYHIFKMAWVRPRNPKPKVVDNTESRKNLLLYFSGQRARPNPHRIDRPTKLDPILQDFAQNQKVAATTTLQKKKKQPPPSEKRPHPVPPPQPVEVVVDYESDLDEVEEEQYVQPPPRRVIQQPRYIHAPVSMPPPASPQRMLPEVLPRRAPMEWESRERPSWESRSNASSRWASAVTPLPGLI